MRRKNIVQGLAFSLSLLLLTVVVLGYQNCGDSLPQDVFMTPSQDTSKDTSSLAPLEISFTEAKIIVGDNELQAFGVCKVAHGVRGEIRWNLTKSSCAHCDPHTFIQSDGCINGKFHVTERLPDTISETLLGEIYMVKVRLIPKDRETNKVLGPFVEKTTMAFVSIENSVPIITQDLNTVGRTDIGSTYVMEVLASGPGVLTYQWFKDNIPLLKQNTNKLTLNPVQLSDAGHYKVRVGVTGGQTIDSQELKLTVDQIFTKIVTCESIHYQPNRCNLGTNMVVISVNMSHQLSRSQCTQYLTWTYRENAIYVNSGCRAKFTVHYKKK